MDRDDDVRRHLIERFTRWLDDVLASEDPPEGLAAEVLAELEGTVDVDRVAALDDSLDARALWSALTSLSQEVKLQGRAFKDLSEQASSLLGVGSGLEAVRESQERIARAVERLGAESRAAREEAAAELVAEGERRGHREILDLVLDLRDRLRRGLAVTEQIQSRREEAPAPRRGWLQRLLHPEIPRAARSEEKVVAAMREGYNLTLERLSEALARLGVEEVACEGRPFDPHRMEAVDLTRTDDVAEGTVLEVVRSGFLWRGEILRPARVRVAAAARSGTKAS